MLVVKLATSKSLCVCDGRARFYDYNPPTTNPGIAIFDDGSCHDLAARLSEPRTSPALAVSLAQRRRKEHTQDTRLAVVLRSVLELCGVFAHTLHLFSVI